MEREEDSQFTHKESCPSCGSRDNLARYTDGHGYCFGCFYHEPGDGATSTPKRKTVAANLDEYVSAEIRGLPARQISEETCRFFGVRVGKHKGELSHFYPYYKDSQVIACKVRGPDKAFAVIGDGHKMPMFGQNLWAKGKKLVVTEGEIDAMTVSQVQGHKWPVVSLPSGAPSAKKAMAQHMDFFEGFEEIVLMFDMDTVGQDAAKACAELFPPGKAKIASLPLKDPNECLKEGKGADVIQAIWNAKAYRPDGIVGVSDVISELDREVTHGLPWFIPKLSEVTYGRRYGEVYTIGAGTGIGKTDFVLQQAAYDIEELKLKVGLVFLEQRPAETVTRLAGKIAGRRFHVPDGSWEREERTKAVADLEGKVVMYDSFGETEWGVVSAKIRFMAHAEDVRVFYVDNLTAMADTSNERESLEALMKDVAGLANELKIIVHLISHLSTPEGKSHEEGGAVSIKSFKGSRSIGFWSFLMLGLERNQQSEDPEERNTTTLRVLKDRFTGAATGTLIKLGYDRTTGRLYDQEGGFAPEPDEAAYTF
jgi:twinkle protein